MLDPAETAVPELLHAILDKIARVEEVVTCLSRKQAVQEWYTSDELAEIVGKSSFTVREWCRLGRIRGNKKRSGRGRHPAWVISHEELLRYRAEGLRPPSGGRDE